MNNRLAVHTGPFPASATAWTAVFHFRAAAFGAAFIGSTHSVCPSGMTADPWMPSPGGVHRGNTVIGPLNPSARLATTRRLYTPFCTSGTFGSMTSIEYGALSHTATAVRSK